MTTTKNKDYINPFRLYSNKSIFSPSSNENLPKNKRENSISNDRLSIRKIPCLKKSYKDNEKFVLNITREKKFEKESLDEYIRKKREMFLVQYMISVKCDDIRKLEILAVREEEQLQLAEKYLEEDAVNFDEFIRENDRTSSEAIKQAENETKIKIERLAEIRRLNSQIMSIKSEISKYEDQLHEFEIYREFLESLSPLEWVNERRHETELRIRARKKLMVRKSDSVFTNSEGFAIEDTSVCEEGTGLMTNKFFEDDLLIMELYFKNPRQLLDMFAELEEQNLSLIQNTQETEEVLDQIKKNIASTECQMEKESKVLNEQIEKLKAQIASENERAKELDLKSKMFSFCEFATENQEQLLAQLSIKVRDVYKACFGESDLNMSTLQMLTGIENLLEDLLQQIEVMPKNKVEAAEKVKERERRLKQRAEKFELQKKLQAERMEKALLRANAEIKKKVGRRLVNRSEPPLEKRYNVGESDMVNKDEEELAYYFMP